ncbi:uncharacterized protein LOC5515855 [Nematostella vectensis]|uniref:uncharacterized protein LOC5515855 n=1 Tax=Nematostella vectensis TaxID=45351 RepID=UPI0020770F32|nr:uncharacterized protein LOC5515855 [Nematostella vectensis]
MADDKDTRSAYKQSNEFPSYYFPFYRDGQQEQSFIEYGSSSSHNLNVNGRSGLILESKHRRNGGRYYTALHATIPLMQPCQTSHLCKSYPEVEIKLNHRQDDFRSTLATQICNFAQDYPDIQFTIAGALQDEFKNDNLQMYSTIFKSSKQEQVNELSEALSDIPSEVLFDLLNESVNEQKNEKFYFDILQGNTLSYCSNWDPNTGVLFYPNGPTLETLNMSYVSFDKHDLNSNSCNSNQLWKPSLRSSSKAFDVSGTIRQVNAVSIWNRIFVGTRSRYSCCMFEVSRPSDEDNEKVTLNPVESIACQTTPSCIAVSPYIPAEAIIVMETGEAYLWRCNRSVEPIYIMPLAEKESHPWYQCIYGPNPRCGLLANSLVADFVDFRVRPSSQNQLFSVTSSHLNVQERISAIQRHPSNAHYYLLGTDQSLLLLDDRFVQHPALSWRHHLQDPVQFMDVTTDHTDTILMLSGSIHREVHCFRYSSGNEVHCAVPLAGAVSTQPPSSSGLPWKVSSYDHWPLLLPASSRPLPLDLKNRLIEPLVGSCIVPFSSTSNKGFVVIQMSACGDIFYQPFAGDTGSENAHRTLPEESIRRCEKWIGSVCQLIQKDPLSSDRNSEEVNSYNLFASMIDVKEPHLSCVLCRESSKLIHSAVSSDPADICPRCGVCVNTGGLLKLSLRNNKVLRRAQTEECDKMDGKPSKTQVFDTFQDPLSRSLIFNWNEDIPTPTDFGDTPDTEKDLESSRENQTDPATPQPEIPHSLDNDTVIPQGEASLDNQKEFLLPLPTGAAVSRTLSQPVTGLLHSPLGGTPNPRPDSSDRDIFLGQQSPLRDETDLGPVLLKKTPSTSKKAKRNITNTMGF